ncbi:MAG: A24 family peptidase [Proteobacteria bacterium]|nr:A24 family peptidase [Pseudomonadota bacterium]
MIELFNIYPSLYLSTIFILGLLVGSFLNVVILRLPVMMKRDWQQQCCELLDLDDTEYHKEKTNINLITPRSHCPDCKHQIKAIENIPVISYMFLKGKCSNCGNKISIRYPLVELVSALTVVIVAFYFGVSLQTLFAICLTWALIALSMIDFDRQLLPDDITLPLLWLGIIINLFNIFTDIESSILGAIFGYGSLWFVYIIFKLVTGKEGMGHGDFKLLAVLGAWFGWQILPLIIILSSLVGAIIGIALIVFKSYDKSTAIPFGPYLAIAGWVSMLWGPYIMSAYLNAVI